MRDNECQTRESLFCNSSSTSDSTANKSASISPSPPPPCTIRRSHIKPANNSQLPPINTPPIGFTTFGYKNNQKPDKINRSSKEHRFRAEAVIEMERFKSPKHDTSSTDSKPSRPYSVQSTKSAPDVIVTHWQRWQAEWEPYKRRQPRPYLKTTGAMLPSLRSMSLVNVKDSVAQCNIATITRQWFFFFSIKMIKILRMFEKKNKKKNFHPDFVLLPCPCKPLIPIIRWWIVSFIFFCSFFFSFLVLFSMKYNCYLLLLLSFRYFFRKAKRDGIAFFF